jgi:hypothetical protein
MAGKKKEELPLRNLLGTYDQFGVSTPLDQNLQSIGLGNNVNLSTMLLQPKQKLSVSKKPEIPGFDPRMSIDPATLNKDRILSPKETVNKVTGFLGNVLSGGSKPTVQYDEFGQKIVEKPAVKPAPTAVKEEIKPKDVKNISKQVTQAIVEKKAADDPSWFERNKKGLRDAGIILSGALASFGEGIKGGNQAAAGERMMANLDAASKADEEEILDDPNSAQSKEAQSLFKQLYGNRVKMPENLTASQFRSQSPVFDKILQRRLAEMQVAKPIEKKPLNESQQKIKTNAAQALKAIQDMRSELEKGSNTFSIIGDNKFSNAKRAFGEGFGRAQSGGVIGPDEGKNFAKFAPEWTDSAEIQKQKLDDAEAEMRSRLMDLGVDPEEAVGSRQVIKVRDKATGKMLKTDRLGNVLGEY